MSDMYQKNINTFYLFNKYRHVCTQYKYRIVQYITNISLNTIQNCKYKLIT